MTMLSQLLPRQADNTYRGQKLALWIFGLFVLMRLAMGLNTVFNGRNVAVTADGIPLDTYTPAGAQAVVTMFALLGVSTLVNAVLCIVVLVRYRALVPFMFALLFLQHLARGAILRVMPIPRVGSPPASIVNVVLLSLLVVGLVLSLWNRKPPAPSPAA